MQKFIPDKLFKEILNQYLMVHWTDHWSSMRSMPVQMRQGTDWRLSLLDDNITAELKQLLITKFPNRAETIDQLSFFFNKLHDGDFISDCSYNEFIISVTNNGTKWYDSSRGEYIELGYNEAVDTGGMTLQLPQLEDSAYYFIGAFKYTEYTGDGPSRI